MDKFVVKIRNTAPHICKYVVCRLVNGELWYYGTWDDKERAEEVAGMFENGLVCEVARE